MMDGSDNYNMDMQRLVNLVNSCDQQTSTLRMQLAEIDSALSEIAEDREVYRIVGNIMVASDYDSVKTDLENQKELVQKRIDMLDKEKKKARDELDAHRKENPGAKKEEDD